MMKVPNVETTGKLCERYERVCALASQLAPMRVKALEQRTAERRRQIVREMITIATEARELTGDDMPTMRAALDATLDGMVEALRRLDGVGTA